MAPPFILPLLLCVVRVAFYSFYFSLSLGLSDVVADVPLFFVCFYISPELPLSKPLLTPSVSTVPRLVFCFSFVLPRLLFFASPSGEEDILRKMTISERSGVV